MLIHSSPPGDRIASLRAAPSGADGRMLPAALHAIIMTCLARIFARLEQIFLLWQAGTLPAPLARHAHTTQPASEQHQAGQSSDNAPSLPSSWRLGVEPCRARRQAATARSPAAHATEIRIPDRVPKTPRAITPDSNSSFRTTATRTADTENFVFRHLVDNASARPYYYDIIINKPRPHQPLVGNPSRRGTDWAECAANVTVSRCASHQSVAPRLFAYDRNVSPSPCENALLAGNADHGPAAKRDIPGLFPAQTSTPPRPRAMLSPTGQGMRHGQ